MPSTLLRVAAAGAAILGAGLAIGCPGTRCARVDGPPGRCVDLVCPPGADARDGDCACREGSTVVLGACVSFDLAEAFCGADAQVQPGGACSPKECAPGHALDVESGLCLPEARTLAALTPGGGEPPPDQRASCPFGELVSRAGQPLCLMGELSCGRGEVFERNADAGSGRSSLMGGRCRAAKPCGAGSIFDEISDECVRVVRAGGSDHVVDVGAWARLALGIDGGEGTRALCAPVRAALGEVAGRARLSLRLTFPDNDVTQSSGRINAQQTPTAILDAAERSLDQLLETLRRLGGIATAGAVSLNVACTAASTGIPSAENVRDAGSE